jgi:hypothetical protein
MVSERKELFIMEGNKWTSRVVAYLASGLLFAPALIGCGSSQSGANMPPVDDTSSKPQVMQTQQQKPGLSTGKKLAILAGAAALYYMYKKNQQKRAQGDTTQPQYYLSKNGRVYYRDQSGRAHWVSAPAQGFQVPQDEAQQYSGFQGYQGQTQGRTLSDVYSQSGNQGDTAPQGGY